MKRVGIFCLLALFQFSILAGQAGVIIKLKGQVTLKDVLLQVNDIIQEGDIIKTGTKSFVQIKMNDNTQINLGPNSVFDINKYSPSGVERDNVLNLIKGKLRINILKKASGKEKITVKTGLISLGVRGTEILTSSYSVANSPSSDVLLTKGSVKVSGPGFNSFDLKPGEYFNSQDLFKNGLKAIKKANEKVLRSMRTSSDFLPNLQAPSGIMNPLSSALGVLSAPVAVQAIKNSFVPSLGSSDNSDSKKTELEKVAVKEENEPEQAKVDPTQSKVKGVKEYQYNLKKEPWEIRDAVMNYKKNKKDNKCWFFFYKKIPGSGEAELFRRARDCDEYEYDL
ncbi:MAG: FecR domain-containing protein [Oligoflexia bacterium]|nr:FecR domain-containing protein [Oligoflexia bacterium]